MPDVTIEETETSLQWQGGVAPKLIIEAAAPFFTAEGIPVNNGGGPFREEWETEVDEDGYVVIPDVILPSTEDSSIPTVTYYAYFQKANAYDPASRTPFSTFGVQRGFRVPPSPTTTTWEDIDANMSGTFVSAPADKSVGGNLGVAGNATIGGDVTIEGDLINMPNAPGYKVNDKQVLSTQLPNVPDLDGTDAGRDALIQALVDLVRHHGLVSNLFESTLNDSLISAWLMSDLTDSVGSNHLTNTGGVTFDEDGANFSGSNQLSVANNASLQIPFRQSWAVAALVKLNNKSATQTIVSKADGASANEFSLVYAGDAIDRFRLNVYPGGNTVEHVDADSAGSPAVDTDYLVVCGYDALANEIWISINGDTPDAASATLTSHPYTAPLLVGSLAGGAYRLNGSVRFLLLWDKTLVAEEIAELNENQDALTVPLQDETTARLENLIQPYHLHDNRAVAYADAETGYFYSLPYARAVFTTSATSMDVEIYSNNNEAGAQGRLYNVRVNGVDYALPEAPQSTGTVATETIALPAGNKTVEVWSGFQALFSGVVKGVWLRRITFNQPAQVKTPGNKQPHVVIVGDSIACGAGADVPTREGWTMLLRDAYPGSVAIEAWGGRSLFQEASDGTARAAFVQKIVTQNPDVIWLAIGTNDYGGVGFGEQSASDFGADYAALLDDLHAALPAALIYAESMLPRASEAANNFGNTLPQYRTPIFTACATRPWATFVDGTAVTGWVNGTDLSGDGVHPTTSGHGKQEDYALTFLGL